MVAPNLPRMGLGMAALGRPGYINLNRQSVFGSESRTIERMREQAFLCLDALFQQQSSTPWIDCARSYGLSEQFVGEYLKDRKIDPSQVVVSSKWGYTYVADFQVSLQADAPHELKDHSKANFLKQVEETAEHLGDYLDLYQIHSATFESGILTDQETHEALYECKKVRGWKLGLSVSSPKQDEIIRAALQIQVNGDRLFDSVQCTFNVLEQRPGKALQEVAEAGMDIIIKEGLANGRALQHPAVLKYSQQLDCAPDALCLACILAQPFAPRVLSGAVTPEHVESNWKALDLQTNGLLDEIMQATCMPSEEYWKERSALAWN